MAAPANMRVHLKTMTNIGSFSSWTTILWMERRAADARLARERFLVGCCVFFTLLLLFFKTPDSGSAFRCWPPPESGTYV